MRSNSVIDRPTRAGHIRAMIGFFAILALSSDLHFFGDTYLPQRVLDKAAVFDEAQPLLGAARHNVVNLEGVVTNAFVPFELKRYLLRMPLEVAPMLRNAGV